MPVSNPIKYEPRKKESFPFVQKKGKAPPGSKWLGRHLRWLEIDLWYDCDPGEVFPPAAGQNLNPEGIVARFLERELKLDASWEELKGGDVDPSTFVGKMVELASVDPIDNSYFAPSTGDGRFSGRKISGQIGEETGSPITFDTERTEPRTPDSDRPPSIPSARTSPIADLVERRRAAATIQPQAPLDPIVPTLANLSLQEACFPSDEVLNPPPPANLDDDYDSDVSVCSTVLSDAGSDAGSFEEDKPEVDVQHTALVFLQSIQKALKASVKDLAVSAVSPVKFDIKIDNAEMTTQPDWNIRITNGDETHEKVIVFVSMMECKRKKHGRSFERILGQEVSELLAMALKLKAYDDRAKEDMAGKGKGKAKKGEAQKNDNSPKTRKTYLTYLISWHHLNCYLSRLEVTDAYLTQLKDKTRIVTDHPVVSRSSILHLKKNGERRKLAMLVAAMAIREMGRLKRNWEVVDLLLS